MSSNDAMLMRAYMYDLPSLNVSITSTSIHKVSPRVSRRRLQWMIRTEDPP